MIKYVRQTKKVGCFFAACFVMGLFRRFCNCSCYFSSRQHSWRRGKRTTASHSLTHWAETFQITHIYAQQELQRHLLQLLHVPALKRKNSHAVFTPCHTDNTHHATLQLVPIPCGRHSREPTLTLLFHPCPAGRIQHDISGLQLSLCVFMRRPNFPVDQLSILGFWIIYLPIIYLLSIRHTSPGESL